MTKRILITGASGFIGGFLVEKALALGFDVTVSIRKGSDRSRLSDARIQFLEINFADENDLRAKLTAAGAFDYVIHNAGITKAAQQQSYFDVNAENTRRLAEILRGQNLLRDRFLLMSSMAAMGPAVDKKFVGLDQKPTPVTAYGESKLLAEQYLAAMPADFHWTAIQPTAVFGPADHEIFQFIQLMHRGFEFHIGRQPQALTFIYVADLVEATFAAMLSPEGVNRKFMICDGRAYSKDDLGAAVSAALGKKPFAKIRLPLSMVGVVATISEKIGAWRNQATAINREKMNELGAASWRCDISPLTDDVHWLPKFNLAEGMKEAVVWYRKHGWL